MKEIVQYKGRNIQLIINDDWDSINVDDIVRIDYGNIVGEVLTIDFLLNRLGILRAEADNIKRKLQLELDIFISKKAKTYRKDNTKEEYNSVRKLVTKQPTLGEINDYVKSSEEYREKAESLLEAEHQYNIVDSIYWAVKGKSDKLELFEVNISDDEMDKLIGGFNGVIVKNVRSELRKVNNNQ